MKAQKSQIKSGIVLSYVYLAISMVAGLLYTPRMLAMLGQSQYGLYSLANSIIGYLSFLGLGLESALVKYTAKFVALEDKEQEQRLGGGFLRIYFVISAVALAVGGFIAFSLKPGMAFGFMTTKLTESEITSLRIIVAILTVNLAISFPMGVFGGVITAHEKFTFRKVVSIIREILMPITILIVLSFGHKAIALVVVHTIFNIAVLLSDFIYARKVLDYKPIFAKFNKSLVKEIIDYSVFIFIGLVVDRISDATNSMVLGAVSGTVAVAVYGIALQINTYYLNFSASIGTFFFPRIVGMTVKNADDKEISDLFIKVGRVQLYVLALICTGFIAFGKDFILLWAGKDYINAYYIVVILMIPTLINRSQSLGTQILLAKNKHRFRAIFFLGVTALDIAISIPLAMMWEGIGAAIGTFVAVIIGPIITMNIYYAKVMHLDIAGYFKNFIPQILKISLVAAAGFAMNYFWRATNWWMLGIQIIAYLVVYLLVVYFWSFNDYEKGLVENILVKLRIKKRSKKL